MWVEIATLTFEHQNNFMRIASIFVIASLFFSLVQTPAHAEDADAYADAVYQASNQTYLPVESIGEADQVYTQFLARDASITLDMGEGEEGTGDLTLYYQILNFGATYRAEFKDADFTTVQSSSAILQLYTSSLSIDYSETTPYRYVKITSTEEEVWKLDAIEAETYETPEEETAEETEEEAIEEETEESEETEETSEEEEESAIRGMLVKLVDDGDPETTVDAAVYVIDENRMRHAFPTESVYTSWWEDFDDVAFIDSENLADYQLSDNVTVRAGTYLVKIVSDPRVYAVEPNGVLRWIASENIAEELYGEAWADRVIDISDAFFTNYTEGENLDSAVHPDGTVGYLPDGQVVYISNATYYTIPSDVYQDMRFQSSFIVRISEETLDLYVDGGELEADDDITYPY